MSFRAADGTVKTSDGDHAAKTGTITINPGQMTKTITIEVKGDSKEEFNETFYLDPFSKCGDSLFAEQPPQPPKHRYIEPKRGDRMCSEVESVARVGRIARRAQIACLMLRCCRTDADKDCLIP
jgi:hypothetical protein